MPLIHGYGSIRQFLVPYNAKIADITHADTNLHTLVLANVGGTGAISGETRKIIMIQIRGQRMAGTGVMYAYPNEGTNGLTVGGAAPYGVGGHIVIILADSQRLQYALSVASDDFDLYCYGYVVEV